ncbi:hypothetical protein VTI74DRAFT_2785 [Chaetomium olivicolor]
MSGALPPPEVQQPDALPPPPSTTSVVMQEVTVDQAQFLDALAHQALGQLGRPSSLPPISSPMPKATPTQPRLPVTRTGTVWRARVTLPRGARRSFQETVPERLWHWTWMVPPRAGALPQRTGSGTPLVSPEQEQEAEQSSGAPGAKGEEDRRLADGDGDGS